ncbi:hypothetical protein ES703_53261 [subsurface metagenome]
MNLEHFNALLGSDCRVFQQPQEWQLFLEFVDAYFKNRKIRNPIVVELGTAGNSQKKFYEELLGARHIGIDILEKRKPDILGDTHDEGTLGQLRSTLGSEPINLLFIDACHNYQDVKRDYEMYGPLTKNVIAFHDIKLQKEEVRLFWKEAYEIEKYNPKLSIYRWNEQQSIAMGIGMILKE